MTLAQAETVYKTIDKEGNVVFSDLKTHDAEVIEIPDAQVLDIPEVKSFKYAPKKDKQKTLPYTKLSITSPSNDATIHSNEGNVNININLEPYLNEKDTVFVYLNGKEALNGKKLDFLLTNIDRGTHNIEVAVKNDKKIELIRSASIMFHLRRISKLSPNRVKKPTVPTPTSE